MALSPPKLRTTAHYLRSAQACLPLLALGLFLMAFFGLVADVAREVRLKGGVAAAESGTELPHLSKRDPVRFISAEARRDGATPPLELAGGILPGTGIGTFALCSGFTPRLSWRSPCSADALAPSNRSRAPPLLA